LKRCEAAIPGLEGYVLSQTPSRGKSEPAAFLVSKTIIGTIVTGSEENRERVGLRGL